MKNEEHENMLGCLPNTDIEESFSWGLNVIEEIKQMWPDYQGQLPALRTIWCWKSS